MEGPLRRPDAVTADGVGDVVGVFVLWMNRLGLILAVGRAHRPETAAGQP